MKQYILLATILGLIPLLTFARVKPELTENQIERRQLKSEQRQELFNQNFSEGNNQNPNRPALERIHEFKAKTPQEGFQFHTSVLEQRIARLENSSFIPEEKRSELIAKFSEELEWLKTKRAELEAAETPEDKAAIKQEIIDHVKTEREQRRSELADSVTLPKTSPTELTEKITERFNAVKEKLANAGKDTTNLASAISVYEQSVVNLNTAAEAVETEKTIETIQALRDAIQNTRLAVTEVRNVLQSIVTGEN